MTTPTLSPVPNDPESIEALQARSKALANDLMAQYAERLAVMIVDGERLAKLEPLGVGEREEVRTLTRQLQASAQRLAVLRGRS